MAKTGDVLVVGGGIIGLTVAYVLAKAGLQVCLQDRREFGQEASWAGAGILPPGQQGRGETPIDKLRASSVAAFQEFSAELKALTGVDNGYWRCGGLERLSIDDLDRPALWQAEGLRFVHQSATQFFLPDFAQVRNPWHLQALLQGCERLGVTLLPNTPYRDNALSVDRHTVFATGAWSGGLLGLPVMPVRGQIVLYRTQAGVVPHIINVGKRYVVPRQDGCVLVGSTEEPEAGFENATTSAGIGELKAFATEIVPELRDAAVEKTWAGLRPGSQDGWPFIGPVPGRAKCYAAVGHFRAGVQQSLGTAWLIREFLTGEPSHIPSEPFRLDRRTITPGRPAFRS